MNCTVAVLCTGVHICRFVSVEGNEREMFNVEHICMWVVAILSLGFFNAVCRLQCMKQGVYKAHFWFKAVHNLDECTQMSNI